MQCYALTWQVPTFAIGLTGVLVAATFGYDVPEIVRAIVSAVGAIFVFALTVALERNPHPAAPREAGVDPLVW